MRENVKYGDSIVEKTKLKGVCQVQQSLICSDEKDSNISETDVAPWCYKWTYRWGDGIVNWAGVGIKHLMIQSSNDLVCLVYWMGL